MKRTYTILGHPFSEVNKLSHSLYGSHCVAYTRGVHSDGLKVLWNKKWNNWAEPTINANGICGVFVFIKQLCYLKKCTLYNLMEMYFYMWKLLFEYWELPYWLCISP